MLLGFLESQRYRRIAFIALILAVGFKIWLIVMDSFPFNSDEAIVALMARHILQGERPIFFYGQSYMGSLDAFLVAGGFRLFGEEVWVIRGLQTLLYLGTVLTTGYLSFLISNSPKISSLAMLLMAIPNINVTLYTTVSLGGYGEMLLIGNLILIVAVKIADRMARNDQAGMEGLWILFGFLIGFGFWVFGFVLVYGIPAFIYLCWYARKVKATRDQRKGILVSHRLIGLKALALVFAGILVGASPCLVYGARFGIVRIFSELTGGAISGVEGLSLWELMLRRMLNTFVFGGTVVFGLRPPWEIRWLAMPLAPLALLTWIGASVYAARRAAGELNQISNDRPHFLLLGGVGLTLILGFAITPFGADPSGRYFLPLSIILAIFAAEWLSSLRTRIEPIS